MRINLASVLVDDQEQARVFCADTLGFVFKHDIPMGADRWLTVVSPQDPHGTELPLKPSGRPIQIAQFDGGTWLECLDAAAR
ncbi:hypothetical protein [Arthrobacter glacialis]|uniref:hypothetical protein n=1 Tax=Arthrobacter glacialis TaxID=1664 RepID=UPI001A9D1116|nr:hypothetical protein [Arthrobacter glacialis]